MTMPTPPKAAAVTHALRRGRFTDSLLLQLRDKMPDPVLVGDGEAPEGAGWTGQQPGQGTYVPWVSLHTGPGAPNLQEPLGRRLASSWRLTYFVKASGGNRSQCDFAQDAARQILSALHGLTVSDGTAGWKVQKSNYVTLGPIDRNDATDPPTFESTDTMEIWLEHT
jgi:hypothetical protein